MEARARKPTPAKCAQQVARAVLELDPSPAWQWPSSIVGSSTARAWSSWLGPCSARRAASEEQSDAGRLPARPHRPSSRLRPIRATSAELLGLLDGHEFLARPDVDVTDEIGRASCRERV